MNKTNIPWADLSWNPTTGCGRGCSWCYARKIAENPRTSEWARLQREPDPLLPGECTQGRDYMEGSGAFPFGFFPTIYPDRLDEPLRRKKPAVIFLGSMGDVFDPAIPDEFRDRIFATVAAAHWHTFVVLTKRAREMKRYFHVRQLGMLLAADYATAHDIRVTHDSSPLPNLVLGVSITNQADADERIPLLLDTPTAKRMVSVEPMLGPVDLDDPYHPRGWLSGWHAEQDHGPHCSPENGCVCNGGYAVQVANEHLDFVAVGGKTPGKPLHEQDDCGSRDASCDADYCSSRMPNTCPASWLRSLRDQCLASGVPFHYKHGGSNPALDGVVYDVGLTPTPPLCGIPTPEEGTE